MEKEMATHSSILAWEIPWTKKPGRLQSPGSQKRVRHDLATKQQQSKNCQPRKLYPVKLCITNGGGMKTFWDEGKLRGFIATRTFSERHAKRSSLDFRKFLRRETNWEET